jgi:hypothetical protein
LKAQWKDLPCGAEPRIELVPSLQQANTLPTEPRRRPLVVLKYKFVGHIATFKKCREWKKKIFFFKISFNLSLLPILPLSQTVKIVVPCFSIF